MRDQALEICRSQRSAASEEVRATSLETLRQMVAAAIGCTLLPKLAVSPATASDLVEIRPFARTVPARTIGIVMRQRFPRAEVVQRLAALATEVGRSALAAR